MTTEIEGLPTLRALQDVRDRLRLVDEILSLTADLRFRLKLDEPNPEIWVLEWDEDDYDSKGSASLAFEYYTSKEAAMRAGEEFCARRNHTDVLPAVWRQTSDEHAAALVYEGKIQTQSVGYGGLLYVARLALADKQ